MLILLFSHNFPGVQYFVSFIEDTGVAIAPHFGQSTKKIAAEATSSRSAPAPGCPSKIMKQPATRNIITAMSCMKVLRYFMSFPLI